jgi:hypothetical protein
MFADQRQAVGQVPAILLRQSYPNPRLKSTAHEIAIKQALRELPLSESDISETASRITDSFLLLEERITNPNSTFFDFRRKIDAVVEHFCPNRLTMADYHRAAVKQPQLFCQAPATIIANIEGVASHFRDHELTLTDYVRAAVKQPQLFCQSPATLIPFP